MVGVLLGKRDSNFTAEFIGLLQYCLAFFMENKKNVILAL
jgi:hypothetical protein